MNQKLKIAFLWHQHQPHYKNVETGKFMMPWTRLHGVKDYVDILKTLEQFPKVKFNVNLVPTMLEQIEEYYLKGTTDNVMDLTLKNPINFTEEDYEEFYNFFFSINEENLVSRLPRYKTLFSRKETKDLNIDEIRDVQALFNLSWLGEHSRRKEAFQNLFEKGRDFTEEDKKTIIKGHLEILKEVIPIHKKLSKNGQIELSLTPFYHPILPLLCDSSVGKIANPNGASPKLKFSYSEDAKTQIELSQKYFKKKFGKKSQGMWPSEGSVSEEVLKIAKESGINWVATDEEILFKSLNSWDRHKLFQVYEYDGVKILFRDHGLSDLIGFTYSKWKPIDAAMNLVKHFENIHRDLINSGSDLSDKIVSVILDGENCWEYYKNNGKEFLEHLCRFLSLSQTLETVKISDFLDSQENFEQLPKVSPGSWVYGNFDIWIGSPEKNNAWDLLTKTRNLIADEEAKETSKKLISKAKEFIFVAEGSDWFWWYGDQNQTDFANEFDRLFRINLIEVYKVFGKKIPKDLEVPVFESKDLESRFSEFQPYSALDWQDVNEIHEISLIESGGTMHTAKKENVIKKIFYGNSESGINFGILFENDVTINNFKLILEDKDNRFILNSLNQDLEIFVKGQNFIELKLNSDSNNFNLLLCESSKILKELELTF
ncbi:MAG: glycoside hydrolase [Calditrichaeota bacterium]|nr:MAG: glycoside hydrolase [Calditrichota bacterium]